jgi:peptide/nickel transport system permease protein
MRSGLLDVVKQDYIRTARAKGLTGHQVLFKHAVRNALIPLVTALGLTLPDLLGGAIVIENTFGWPGMGQLIVSAAQARDYPVVLGTTLVSGLLVILGNLLADIVYMVLDPRIHYA